MEAIFHFRKQMKVPKRLLLVAPTYSGEVTKALLLIPSGSVMVVKRSALGVILRLPSDSPNTIPPNPDSSRFSSESPASDQTI
jgi:hypothetical protein